MWQSAVLYEARIALHLKRTAMQHTKMRRLVKVLSLPQYAVVGILESLWHLTAREAPYGNIGKLSNEDIAAWIDWHGDADALIQALIVCGWLDVSDEDRLSVHDWEEHADDATKKAMSRQKAKVSRQVQTNPDSGGQNTPALPCLAMPEPSQARMEPEMLAKSVQIEGRIVTRRSLMVLTDVCRIEQASDSMDQEIVDKLVTAWNEHEAAKAEQKLEFHSGAEKFFGEGIWKNKAAWPWKKGLGPKQGSGIKKFWTPPEAV